MTSTEPEAKSGNMKLLSDLKIAELRQELEKRRADTSGFRLALIERLSKILKDAGQNVETYLFDTSNPGGSAAVEEAVTNTEDSTAENSGEGDLVVDDLVEQVDEDGDDSLVEQIDDAEEVVEEETDEPREEEDVEMEENVSTQEQDEVDIEKEDDVPESEEVDDENNHDQANEKSEEAEAKEEQQQPAPEDPETRKQKTFANKYTSLWVRGISTITKAADIKALFSTIGKVQTAKIFNTKSTPPTCFGFVTMHDPTDVAVCIEKLHRTNFKGKVISVEKAEKNIAAAASRKGPCTPPPPAATPPPGKDADVPKEGGSDSPVLVSDVQVVESKPTPKAAKPVAAANKKTVADKSSEKPKEGANVSVKKLSNVKKPITAPTPSKPKTSSTTKTLTTVKKSAATVHDSRDSKPPVIRHATSAHRAPPYESSRYIRAREAGDRFRRPLPPPSSRPSYHHHDEHRRSRSPIHMMDRRDMAAMLRRKEEEHRIREEELRLQRERERIRYEREKLEREKLEVQQMRQFQALASSVSAVPSVLAGLSNATSAAAAAAAPSAQRRGPDFHSSSSAPRHRREYVESGPSAARRRSRSPRERRDSRPSDVLIVGRDHDRDRSRSHHRAHHTSTSSTSLHSDRDRYRTDRDSAARRGRDEPPRSDPRDSSRPSGGQAYRSADPYSRSSNISNTSSSYGHGGSSSSYGGQVGGSTGYGYGSSSGSRPSDYGISGYDSSSRGNYGRNETISSSGGVSDYAGRRDDGGYVAPRGRSRDYNDQHGHSSSWSSSMGGGGQRWP
ncbi:hypothetical protein QR680_008547 [Steinernema hermaphroditum]|uniref:RRM domain-containing protein n=1 Tax=Steinernema hermaphroditum TaxID=289476 RepID=A0AA39IJG0_9BILA|nr:hypothetical protein QR680_008547 [Steinernema hermaphroditum]